jgi:hypothetical protein
VLVSPSALDLLDPEELQALVAHEIGHEYFWSRRFAARLVEWLGPTRGQGDRGDRKQ